MARRTVFVSDLSGNEITQPARVTITFPEGKSGAIVLDVDASEISSLIEKGTHQKRRGRPPKVETPVAV